MNKDNVSNIYVERVIIRKKKHIQKHRNLVENMLIIVAILIVFINSSETYGLCSNDNECPYYCGNNGKCQKPITQGEKCSGYDHRSRECDIASWCDSDKNFTCQFLKNFDENCEYDYSCIDNYCDSETKTCQFRLFINDQCQTNRSCHSNYCQTETKTCQSAEESSSSSSFRILITILIAYYLVSRKKTPGIDVGTQTQDVQHTLEN
jgi:hypothetical protein